MIAIITEKPSVAKDIANVLGITQKKDGYWEGNGYLITWAYGHLVTLALPEEYGFYGKKIEDYPFIPKEFILVPRKVRTKQGYKDDPVAVKQLKQISKVFIKCKEIIVATDAGREGELIFRYIYDYLKCKKPFSRLWISSMTDKAIEEGFKNLKNGTDYDGLFLAAQARSQADWLLGINASRTLHIACGQTNNSLGRVQTPTLALICKRYLDNKRFKNQPYWQNSILLKYGDISFRATQAEQFFNKEVADKEYNKIKLIKEATVSLYEREEKVVPTPLLHDLASLQKLANTQHGFSADKTLSVAQKLYEKKYISYPRTGSRYIPDDVFEQIPILIRKLSTYPDFREYIHKQSNQPLTNKTVDSSKITDHHALITTDVIPDKLGNDEAIIYKLIAGRMLEAFSENGINDIHKIVVICDELSFTTQKSIPTYFGWRDVFKHIDDQESDSDDDVILPAVEIGDILEIESANMVQKSTKPKPLYTEATLLTAMENAGRDCDDKEVKAALSGCGIGTPATRSGIIETLYKRDYICLHNKFLVPTKKGLSLYEQISKLQIADVELTGGWESALLKIEKDPNFLSSFDGGIKVYTKQVVTEIASIINLEDNSLQTPFVCPQCKLGKVILWPKMAKCNYSKCNFRIYREICGKMLNDSTIKALLLKGKTSVIKGFKNKQGQSFDAKLIFDRENKITFEYPTKK